MLVVCRAKREASGLPLATDVYVPHRKFITEPCRDRRELKTVNFIKIFFLVYSRTRVILIL